ncbi:MAG TPA: flagellar hook-associated protein FlgK [Gemmatimonadales bacterium]
MSSFGGILSIARLAISAHQTAIQVTSHNIANAETPGYSRQRVSLQENYPALDPAAGLLGTGVLVTDVGQIRDTLLDGSFRRESTSAAGFGLRRDLLGQVEGIFREPTNDGLAATLDQFWNAWSDLANSPLNDTTRSVVRQRGQQVATALNGYDRRLTEISEDTKLRLDSSLGQLNEYSRQVAELNRQIVSFEVGGGTAGDLRDARNRVLDEMSKLVPVDTIARRDGSIAVTLHGQSLVDGSHHKPLEHRMNGAVVEIAFTGSKDALRIQGGELGAMLTVLNDDVPAARGRLDDLAKGIVEAVNGVHVKGWSPAEEPSGTPRPDPWDGSLVHFFDPGNVTAADISLSVKVQSSERYVAAGNVFDGPADNSIALDLAALRDRSAIGDATLATHFRDTVTGIAMSAASAGSSASVHETMAAQADVRRQSVSGVSTDEELLALMRHQQAYVAATRVVTAVDEMMQSLLQMV